MFDFAPHDYDLDLKGQLSGEWEREKEGNLISLMLDVDGSFRFVLSGNSLADFSGKWSVQNKRLYLNVDSIIEGNKEAIGTGINWSIVNLQQNELILGAVNGQDRFTRKVAGK